METIKTMNFPRLVALTSALLAASAPGLRADSDSDTVFPIPFVVRGFQATSSSPFLVKIDRIGTGVWQRLVGPVLSTTLATIPPAVGFGGGGCQLEYSQDRIVTQDGSTITFDVYGLRCEAAASPGAHVTTGSYSNLTVESGSGIGRKLTPAVGAGASRLPLRLGACFTLLHPTSSGRQFQCQNLREALDWRHWCACVKMFQVIRAMEVSHEASAATAT